MLYTSPDGDDEKAIVIFRDEIPKLLDNELFISAFEAWHGFKLFGMPYQGGYREQPCQWCDVVKMFESMYNEHQEMERG